MAQHRINMVANFSEADAAIKNTINNMRIMTGVANRFGESGNAGVSKFVKEMQDLDSKAITTRQRLAVMNTLLKEQEMAFNRLNPASRKLYGADWQAAIDNARQKVAEYNKELQAVGAPGLGGSGGGGLGAFGITKGMIGYQALMKAIQIGKQTIEHAVKTNMEFEQSNAELSAVLGMTKDGIYRLTEQAKELGATTLFTANQITQLQIELGRLGFNRSEISASTEAISKLALATGVDLKDAATMTGSALRAFGYRTSEASRVASVLGVSTTKSALDMEKLKTALGYVSSVSRQAGFEIEDVVAMLGKLVDNGQQASTAGTNLRNIMLDLSNKSSKLSQAIKFVTGKDKIRGLDEFADALRQMREEGINLDDVANVVQKRVTPGFLNLIANVDGISELRDELRGCTGELDNMASKMTNTLQGSVTLMKSAWDGLMISFSQSNGILKNVVDRLTGLINKLREAREAANESDAPSVLPYEKPDNNKIANDLYTDFTARGMSRKTIMANAKEKGDSYGALSNTYKEVLERLEEFQRGNWSEDAAYELAQFIGDKTGANVNNMYNALLSVVGRKDLKSWLTNQQLGYSDLAAQQNMLYEIAKTGRPTNGDISGNSGLDLGDKLGNGKDFTVSERYAEKVEDALDRYQIALNKAAIEYENGMYGEKESNEAKAAYTKKREQAEASLLGAYTDVVAEMQRESENSKYSAEERAKLRVLIDEYMPNIKNESEMVAAITKAYSDLKDLIEKEKEAERERLRQLQAQRSLDERTLNALTTVAKRNGKNLSAEQLGGQSVMDYFGLSGIKTRMSADLELDITDNDWQALVEQINAQLEALNLPKIELDVETGNVIQLTNEVKDMATQWGYVTQAIGSVGQAMQSIEDPSAKIAGIVATAVASIAMGFATASAADSKFGVLPWIAASAAGLANMASMIASIKSVTAEYHAEGGIVGMGPFISKGTDTLPCMLTPGEEVLPMSDPRHIRNMRNMIGGAGMQRIVLTTRLSGRDIILVANNEMRAMGASQGQLLYSH